MMLKLQIAAPFWCAKQLIVQKNDNKMNRETLDFSVDDKTNYHYENSDLLAHEADYAYDYIRAGKRESDILPLESSLKIHEIIEQVRRELGVKYAQDD